MNESDSRFAFMFFVMSVLSTLTIFNDSRSLMALVTEVVERFASLAKFLTWKVLFGCVKIIDSIFSVLFLNGFMLFFCDMCYFIITSYLNLVVLARLFTGHWTVGRVRYLKDFGVLILEVN